MKHEKIMARFITGGAILTDKKGNIANDDGSLEGVETITVSELYDTFIVTGNGTYIGSLRSIADVNESKFIRLEEKDDSLIAQANRYYKLREESKLKFDRFESKKMEEFYDAFSSFNRKQRMENKIIFAFKVSKNSEKGTIKIFEDIHVDRPWDNLMKR